MLERPRRPGPSGLSETLLQGPAVLAKNPLCFVPISGDEAAKGRGAAKRVVRAHVTRVQHARNQHTNSHQNLESWTVKPYIHRDFALAKRKDEPTKTVLRKKPASRSSSSSDDSEESGRSAESPVLAISVPRLASGSQSSDPFWSYPVDYQPELSPLFAHYIENIAVEIADLDEPNEKGLIRKRWFPLIMTEAAPMYAVLLMAASHFAIVEPKAATVINLLHLKARALAEINKALADPKRATSDAIIGAVAKMAAYEAIFGDSGNSVAHMKGLAMMLKMRGGFSTLGLGGLFERMLLWIDLNAAHITGQQRHLCGDDFPTDVHFAAPDPYHFAGIS